MLLHRLEGRLPLWISASRSVHYITDLLLSVSSFASWSDRLQEKTNRMPSSQQLDRFWYFKSSEDVCARQICDIVFVAADLDTV